MEGEAWGRLGHGGMHVFGKLSESGRLCKPPRPGSLCVLLSALSFPPTTLSTHTNHTGCNAVRFWLHIDGSTSPEWDAPTGLVTGISQETVDDLKWVLKVSRVASDVRVGDEGGGRRHTLTHTHTHTHNTHTHTHSPRLTGTLPSSCPCGRTTSWPCAAPTRRPTATARCA